MLIRNACIENNEELKCIRIEDGKFKEIKKDLEPYAQEEVMDLEGKLVLPPFVESHVHLDTCLTLDNHIGICRELYLKVLNVGKSVRNF